jgi:hypothetical protein
MTTTEVQEKSKPMTVGKSNAIQRQKKLKREPRTRHELRSGGHLSWDESLDQIKRPTSAQQHETKGDSPKNISDPAIQNQKVGRRTAQTKFKI